MKKILSLLLLLVSLQLGAWEREYIWPFGKMPDAQPHQIAAMTDVSRAAGFVPDDYRLPYLEWFDQIRLLGEIPRCITTLTDRTWL